MFYGTVRKFFDEKGYGFIDRSADDGLGDAFFHVRDSAWLRTGQPKPGQRVRFDIEFDRRAGKNKAVNVEPVGGAG
jgi:CspA family cold shock protein